MLDVKKLITGFLIIAAAAGSSAFILSNLNYGSSAVATTNTTPTSTLPSDNQGQNAFVPDSNIPPTSDPATILGYQPSPTVDAQAGNPNNLTNALSGAFLSNIVETNPDGIQIDNNGNPSLAQPDNTAVLNDFSDSHALTSVVVPNWDTEALKVKLNITEDASPTAVANYANTLQNIFNQYFITTGLLADENQGSSNYPDINYANTQVQNAFKATVQAATPAPLANFQKSLVKMLVYEKNVLALVQDATNDPVKNALIIQAEAQKYNLAIENLQTQMKNASTLGGFSFGKETARTTNQTFALINKVFGIQTAHALFGLGDITFDPAVFGEFVLKFAEDTALQIVKNALIALVQKNVLSWIQGSGAPRFVQNWATASVNAYSAAAQSALNAQFQCVGNTQLPLLKVLLAVPSTNNGSFCASQFQSQLGNNLKNLFNRFTNWNDYFALYQPQGSIWTQLVTIQDSVSQAANQNNQATQAQNTSSQGFTGSKVCADGSNPTGQSYACVDPSGIITYPYPRGHVPYPCDSNETYKPEPNNGLCGDGSYPQIATPGTVTAQGFGVALDTSPKLVTAASTIAGLLSALTTSLLNTLAQAAITASNQAFASAGQPTGNGGVTVSDSGIPSLATSTIGGSTSTPSSTGSPVQCVPQQQTVALGSSTDTTFDFQAQGGAIDVACALAGNCPSTEGSDGSPTYSWSAPGAESTSGGDGIKPFSATYNATGTFAVSVTASTDNSNAQCQVIITP